MTLSNAVFIIDNNRSTCNDMLLLLRSEGIVSRAYISSSAFLEQLEEQHCGCIIVDARMPDIDGFELIARLKAINCQIPVAMITENADVTLAVKAMKAGAVDFIEKPADSAALLAAVRKGFEITAQNDARQAQVQLVTRRLKALTDREREVFQRLVSGGTNKAIAAELGISPRTVEVHRANVMRALGADSLSDLVRMKMLVESRPSNLQ